MAIFGVLLEAVVGGAVLEKVIAPIIEIAMRTFIETLVETLIEAGTRKLIESFVDSGDRVTTTSLRVDIDV